MSFSLSNKGTLVVLAVMIVLQLYMVTQRGRNTTNTITVQSLASATPCVTLPPNNHTVPVSKVRRSVLPDEPIQTFTQPRTRNVVSVLIPEINITKIVLIIKDIDTRLKDNLSSDFVVFHSGYTDDQGVIDKVKRESQTKRNLQFINVDGSFHTFPKGFDPNLETSTFRKRSKWGYHGMIKFWFSDIFHLPQLSDVKYLMRFDDDGRFPDIIPDLFQTMKEKKAVYFAGKRSIDWAPQGCQHLIPFLRNWPIENNFTARSPVVWKEGVSLLDDVPYAYATNFEILDFDLFVLPEVVKFSKDVIDSHGIFRYRWGDAPLRYYTLALFSQPNQTIHRKDHPFQYCHHKDCA